ncbi:hypothetical protein [Celerinatantimonas sp. YJH-8]|uniref:hypothetical protein n=1 Tax=Celerinatantimonas sp. YJH-8 TaxID=3228714 RepID=UPI0038C054BB
MWSFALATQLKSQTPQLAQLIKEEPMLQHWLGEALSHSLAHPHTRDERLGRILGFITAREPQLPRRQAYLIHDQALRLRTIICELSQGSAVGGNRR